MKNTVLMTIACVMLSTVLFAEGPKPDAVVKMGLKEAIVDGATIYYEPCLEEKLAVLKKVYADYRKRMKEYKEASSLSSPEWDSKKAAIVNDICKIVGSDNELKTKLLSVANSFTDSDKTISLPLVGTNNVIYMALQETTKDFLRAGGTLPNLSYDKATDSAEFKIYFGSDRDNASNQELLLPVKSADEAETVLNQIFTILPKQIGKIPSKMGFITIHEIAEVGIVERMRSGDPYKRWFTDGFANAITYDVVSHQYSKKDAESFIEQYNIEPYQNLKDNLNLQYWMSAQFTFVNNWPIKKEQEYNYARYCFATHEARRIVKAHGIECVKKILDTYVANGQKKPGAILTAIQQATGDDIQKHLSQYQSFKTKEDGLACYKEEVEAAMSGTDAEAAVFSMLRLLDLLGEQPLEKESLRLRQTIAMALILAGYPEEATKSITDFADWMCKFENPQNRYAGRHLVIMHAMQIKKPQVALECAQKVLEDKPDDVYALTIMMIMAQAEKDSQKAIEIAKQICKIQTDEEGQCHKIAKQLLAEKEK